MQENFIIGIGGTGSRVLEAFVHCCAAGFGPKEKVHLMLVDPDQANGNLDRTLKLVANYRALRERLAGQLNPRNPAFRTELVTAIDPVWKVVDGTNQTLKSYIGYDDLQQRSPALKGLADLLFTEQERKTKLNEGFRGHPNIGAVVMSDPPFNDPHSALGGLVAAKQPGKNARVFLVGSIFGGTGAAGFPTLAKVLRKADIADGWGSFVLGGALVLPYFSFGDTPVNRGEEMFVTQQDFPVATQAALHYYAETNLPIDEYYFVGDSLSQEVGKFSPGKKEQLNRPHYVELVSALAAFDFFRAPEPGKSNGNAPRKRQYFIAGRTTATVGWNNLPVTREGETGNTPEGLRDELRRLISCFTLFSYSYLELGLAEYMPKIRQGIALKDNWFQEGFPEYKRSRTAATDPGNDDYRDLLDTKVAAYAKSFLGWVTGLAEYDESQNPRVQLINREALLRGGAQGHAAAPDAARLRPLAGEGEAGANLDSLVFGFERASDKRRVGGKAGFVQQLNREHPHKPTQDPAVRFLNLFFNASADFLGFEDTTASQR